MTLDERTAGAALRQVAAQAHPARLPADLWTRGRRRHRRRVAAAAGVVLVLLVAVGVVPALALARHAPAPAQQLPSVPSRVLDPLPLQPYLVDGPNGPASLIVTGPGGFGKMDSPLDGYEDRAIVVGRDGQYRYLRQYDGFDAGETALLSPDGRWVAGNAIEGAGVMNTTTGHSYTYGQGRPLTWSPDGRLLVVLGSGQRRLLDLDTGAMVDAGAYGPARSVFSPDGRLLATKIGTELMIRDIAAGTERTLSGLAYDSVLAGPGAWRSDGRIAVWTAISCAGGCPDGWADFTLSYVDVETGEDVTGPTLMPVRAEQASLLGWQSDGDAVVTLTFRMEGRPGLPPKVVALHPGGGQTTLVTTPDSADRIDVARNLLDRFGAPPPSLGSRWLDAGQVWAPQVLKVNAVIALVVVAWLAYRRVRSRRSRHGSGS